MKSSAAGNDSSAGTLKVGFDGRALTSPAAGIRRYARELFTTLHALGEPLTLVMLGGRPEAAPPGVMYVPEPIHPPTNAGWMLVGLPIAARRGAVDLVHAPAYTAPAWSPVPVVLTIHDVSYARHPEWFPYKRDWMRRAFYRRSALAATSIVTDSEFSATEIHAAYGIQRERITVVPLGVGESFGTLTLARADRPAGIDQPFVVHVGDLHERRNLVMLTGALLEARKRLSPENRPMLVLAGVDRGIGEQLRCMTVEDPDAIVLLGKVDEATLQRLYADAAALVYPSLYEGFGLPVLEAMAAGLPVIAARAASIPEVVGDAACLLHPRAHEQWTEALVRVVNDRAWTDRLRTAGKQRAAAFTWERTARETLEVYRRALVGRRLQ